MPEPLVRELAGGNVGITLESHSFSQSIWAATVLDRGYSRTRSDRRAIGAIDPESPPTYLDGVLFSSITGDQRTSLIEVPGGLALVRISDATAIITLAGDDEDLFGEAIEFICEQLPEPESPEVTTPVTFWFEAEGNGQSAHTRIEPHSWRDLADGYSAGVASQLGDLMDLETVPSAGRLILWHGEPGTGKTHALRALAHEWRDWCSLQLISDPERLVGSGMNYMMNVLTMSDPESDQDRAHKLIVLEDAGELLAADARSQVGPGLSRLLNLSDGLLGVGTNAIVLISTNEPLGRIHPAVHRPGRCLAEIEFTALDVGEANGWLESYGCEARVTSPKTLAELYAIRDGRLVNTERPAVGFGLERADRAA